MDEVEPKAAAKYLHLLFKAYGLSEAIEHTVQQWAPGSLTHYFAQIGSHDSSFKYDPVTPPPLTYPVYRLNESVKMKTGEEIPQTGFYLPDLPDSFPRLQVKSRQAGQTRIPKNDPEYPGSRMLAPCTWTLIEKVADSGSELGAAVNQFQQPTNLRAGQPATHSGYWFTVAQENSRQYFKQGQVLPEIKHQDWGEVYWQFDGEA